MILERGPVLEATGERFLLSMDLQIALEHWHRYMAIVNFIRDRDVADVASGEGYGSHFLAGFARSVVGVDVSADAVAHAQARYQRENLRYAEGSMDAIPVADQSLDVLVSFETFEHAGEDAQRGFIAEAKRVLRPGGVLIVSTPDRDVYSTMRGFENEYHVRELTAAEFSAVLGDAFPHVRMAKQRCAQMSLIVESDIPSHSIKLDGQKEYVPSNEPFAYEYLIAVCSNAPLEGALSTSVGFDESMLRSLHDRKTQTIMELERASYGDQAHIKILQDVRATLEREHVGLQMNLEAARADAEALVAQLGEVRLREAAAHVAVAEAEARLAESERARRALEERLRPKNYARELVGQLDRKGRKSLARLRRRALEALQR